MIQMVFCHFLPCTKGDGNASAINNAHCFSVSFRSASLRGTVQKDWEIAYPIGFARIRGARFTHGYAPAAAYSFE